MALYSPHAYDRSRPVGSYWETTVDVDRRAYPALARDITTDVAVIGGGFTGLNAALRLAGTHGVDVAVCEAGDIGWGASGRNGGFCCAGGSKRSLPSLAKQFGRAETQRFLDAQRAAIHHVRALLDGHGIDADTHSDGELCLAHRPREADALHAEADWLKRELGLHAAVHDRRELAEMGVAGPEFHGGLTHPDGFALNPMKYVTGLAEAAREAGATIYARTPVTAIARDGTGWQLRTSGATLRARRLVVATNGYLEETLPGAPVDALKGRLLPALSSILVTRPLTPEELAAQGWTSHQMSYDSRRLLHYFRLMPDGRFLFGMRGGTDTDPKSDVAVRRRILGDFHRMFPAWRDVEATHIWSGLVCLARDLSAFVGPLRDAPGAFAALAYHGNGVAMGSWCGARVADIAAGAAASDAVPAVLRGPLRRLPLPALRKTYLKAAYRWYALADERP